MEKLKGNVEKALVKLADKDKKLALAAAEKAAAVHGFSLSDLTGSVTPPKKRKIKTGTKKVSVAKYQNLDDPSQTWTGKGRQPNWFKTAVTSGTSPDAMEI